MHPQLSAVAARLRALRESAGVSRAALARDLGLAPPLYARYETGRTDIPVGVLHRVAARFGVELTALFTGDEPRLHTWCVVRRGTGPAVARRHQYQYENLAAGFMRKRMEPFLVTVEPRPARSRPPPSRHPGHEFDYVLEGCLVVNLRGRDIVLKEGDALFFDAGEPHSMRARGRCRARFLAIIA